MGQMTRCGVCGGSLVDMVVGVHLEKRCLTCQPLYPRGQGRVITLPSRPSVPEAMERTQQTLRLLEKYPETHKEQEKEWRKTESRLEQGHEEVRQSLERTKRTISAIQCQERVNAIKRKTQEQADRHLRDIALVEYFQNPDNKKKLELGIAERRERIYALGEEQEK
ncbi:hypothetical protein MUP01_02410 [Candidatus Bathyarchaeota archaeon]|nr:hypothetical protein [Candidatus Bathyarchaeota archaeon]